MTKAVPKARPGARLIDDGCQFAVYSETAERIELCLFDEAGAETARVPMQPHSDHLWRAFVPGIVAGQRYAYRAAGRYAPEEGLRFNFNKLLLDPYATRFSSELHIVDAMRDNNSRDSAANMPRCIVDNPGGEPAISSPVPWSELIIYEANVRGYTMRHPAIGDHERGRFTGMTNGDILGYLKSLGITAIELMPVQEYADEQFLQRRGLRNLWGYNTFGFFAPAWRLANNDPVTEFRDMVRALHDAGLEVILDVAYNHTAESDANGPSISFRGLDNPTYYRLDNRGGYINDTGTGNTINVDHPVVRRMIVDSLAYWVDAFGIDGFRFDLAATLGRNKHGFSAGHAMFAEIQAHPSLANTRLIAEPWDIGPGGYQLGHFPARWGEWNDRFRDDVRQFWRGDVAADVLARRLHGSADVFEKSAKAPTSSINLVTAHDGFTLLDTASYERRHNEANGENNRDGHRHNFSFNHGIEGISDNPEINDARRRYRLNLLGSLLLSQGTPMLLAGDEFGNSQYGNNNAYAQDNETGWLDWRGLSKDPDFVDTVRALVRLRRECPLFRQPLYKHDSAAIRWFGTDGVDVPGEHWPAARALGLHWLADSDEALILLNGSDQPVCFRLPACETGSHWQCRFDSAISDAKATDELAAQSIRACVLSRPTSSN